jgi:catalase
MGGPVEDPSVMEPPLRISGDAERYNHRDGNDDYAQPRALHDLMSADSRSRLYRNTAEAMQGVPDVIIDRVLVHYDRISPAYGDGIRAARAALAGGLKAAE